MYSVGGFVGVGLIALPGMPHGASSETVVPVGQAMRRSGIDLPGDGWVL